VLFSSRVRVRIRFSVWLRTGICTIVPIISITLPLSSKLPLLWKLYKNAVMLYVSTERTLMQNAVTEKDERGREKAYCVNIQSACRIDTLIYLFKYVSFQQQSTY